MILPVFEKAFGFVFEQTKINLMASLKSSPTCSQDTPNKVLKLRLECVNSFSAQYVYQAFYKLVKSRGSMMQAGNIIVITAKT